MILLGEDELPLARRQVEGVIARQARYLISPEPGRIDDHLEVIKSNARDGYLPNYFRRVTDDGYAPDLLRKCTQLIMKPETMDILTDALQRFPNLLTLEDFVAPNGAGWGFVDETIHQAQARVQTFDTLVGRPRYERR